MAAVRVGHPSLRRLQRWLDGEEDGLDRHLETCERCASRIESLALEESTVLQPLLEVLTPPEELTSRLRGGIDERMRSREDLTLLSELFGLPIRAARVMSTTSQGET
jgi:hypothetical protein